MRQRTKKIVRDRRHKDEAEKIYREKYGIRKRRIYVGQNGERALKIRTYKEHIEALIKGVFGYQSVGGKVQHQRHA